ncbi:hypothetical protein [Streptomyces sp. NPDC056821]|uniref:hypothetical protein n=1 Tax=unclassified Streptomyces TaxID=2593676 RepID=UPI0036769F35
MAAHFGSRQRTIAVVHRAGSDISHLVLPEWMNGQITVRIPTAALTAATGLGRDQLPGTELTVTVDLGAADESALHPEKPRLAPAWLPQAG